MSQLRSKIKQQRPFRSSEEETYLSLQRTASLLNQALTRWLKNRSKGLTPSQYNVLRILRGASPEALTCGEISERLVTPGPDVTRLLDRLVSRTLAERERSEGDRRVVRARISAQGLELLASLDGPLEGWLRDHLGQLAPQQHNALTDLLERARQAVD
ncbi:MAG: MarR family transcriptional regulator [Acidobacteriota bacterium]